MNREVEETHRILRERSNKIRDKENDINRIEDEMKKKKSKFNDYEKDQIEKRIQRQKELQSLKNEIEKYQKINEENQKINEELGLNIKEKQEKIQKLDDITNKHDGTRLEVINEFIEEVSMLIDPTKTKEFNILIHCFFEVENISLEERLDLYDKELKRIQGSKEATVSQNLRK